MLNFGVISFFKSAIKLSVILTSISRLCHSPSSCRSIEQFKQCRFLVMGVSCSKEIAISFSVPFKWDRLSTSGGETSATCLLLKYRMADHNGSFVSGVLMCSLLILNKQEAIILFWGISPLSRTVDVDRIH